MKGRHLAMIAILAVVAVSLAVTLWATRGAGPAAFGDENVVGIVHINGPIMGGESVEGLFSSAVGAHDIMAQLQEALNDDTIKAVVIRLNTPGGSAAASQEIGREVERLQQAGKVVVASMGDVAASGGYWIAALADHIMASPATITGSIGVIMQLTNLEGLYEKLGIRVETIKSGEHKDLGNPARELTPEERALLEALVDDMYDQFVSVVAEGRSLPRETVLRLADGRIFSGRQALELGLVDSLGNFQDAIERAAELGGISDAYTVRELGERSPLELFLRQLQLGWPWRDVSTEGLTLIRWVLYPQPQLR